MAEKRKVKNPGKLFCRLMAYIFRKYGIACFLVLVFIVLSVLANTQGTMFMKTLIDSYIIPILNSPDKGICIGKLCSSDNFFIGSIQFTVADIFHYAGGKEVGILQYDTKGMS